MNPLAALARSVLFAAAVSFVTAPAALAAGDDPLARHFGGPFKLTAHDDRTVSSADFRGKFMLVSFGYTHCPDICPTVLADVTRVLEDLGPVADMVQPVFITVDPARDSAGVLAEYRKSFHPRLIMLTGSEAQIAAVAKAYRVHRRKYLFKKQANPEPDDYGVDHGSLVYFMGRDGKFITFFPYGTAPEKMEATMKSYLEKAASLH